VMHIGINRAVTLLAEKAARGGTGRRGMPKGKILGEHPEFGGPVTQHDGRFGPYVSHNKVNATLPSTSDPANVSLDEAVTLIAERAAKAGNGKTPKAPKKKAAPKRKAAKEEVPTGEAPPKPKRVRKKKIEASPEVAPTNEAPAAPKTEPVQD